MISMGFARFQLFDKLMAIFCLSSALVATILNGWVGIELKRPTKRAKQASPLLLCSLQQFCFRPVQSCQL